MDWFEDLFGFRESREDVYRWLTVEGEVLRPAKNGREWGCGRLETPSLGELRERVQVGGRGPLTVRNVVGEAGRLHANGANAGALFQAASQFNLLEMVGPGVTPDEGITGYAMDHTQGPACAMAAAAGTLYRNWFAEVDGADDVGQTADRQIDCLRDVQQALGADGAPLWSMRNGYALQERDATLERFTTAWRELGEEGRERVRDALRIGVQANVEVTQEAAGHRVHQAYCSAVPLGHYARLGGSEWDEFARLVLEGTYEATLLAAIELEAPVFLTFVGGGVFGNRMEWIRDAMERAFTAVADSGLEVNIVHFRDIDERFAGLARA